MAVADPQLAVRVAVDSAAGRRVVVDVAGVQRVLGAEGRDRVVDLDVEVVDRDREARREPRREHDAVGVRVRLLRRQVVLPPWRKLYWPAGLSSAFAPDLCPPARPRRCTPPRSPPDRGFAAPQGSPVHVEQVEALRREQLDDVGRTDRTLVAAAQADVLDRRPLEAELVGVGLHAVAVVRVPVRGVERQALHAGTILGDRHAAFEEQLFDLGAAADADGRAAGTGELARRLQRVDLVLQRVAAPLGAEHHLDAVGGERRLDAVHPEVTVHHGVVDLLVDAAGLEAGCLEIVELVLRDAARLERIPGHAGRVGAVDDGLAGRHAADVDHVQRALQAVDRRSN